MGISELANALIDPKILIYILIIISSQVLLWYLSYNKRQKIAKQRSKEGLPPDIIINKSEHLEDIRRESIRESIVLVVTIFSLPFIIIGIICIYKELPSDVTGINTWSDKFYYMVKEEGRGLVITFVGLLVWLLFSGTDVAKGFLGGLGFKTLMAFKNPFQVGDRVTLKGYAGKVISISTFYVKLQTPNDDLVSIPTSGLWSEVLTSANAGERSSLCVMDFFLAPFVTKDELQKSEDTIWDAIQASPYLEVANPMQIFFTQNNNSIQLTAKAVASTYNEALFKSEVTKAFLNFTAEHKIPLASLRNRTK
jgi:hypothetical protein